MNEVRKYLGADRIDRETKPVQSQQQTRSDILDPPQTLVLVVTIHMKIKLKLIILILIIKTNGNIGKQTDNEHSNKNVFQISNYVGFAVGFLV